MLDVHQALGWARHPRPRVFWDGNAGAWCYQAPGRLPVQAVSWEAAVRAAGFLATVAPLQTFTATMAEHEQQQRQAEQPRRRWWLW